MPRNMILGITLPKLLGFVVTDCILESNLRSSRADRLDKNTPSVTTHSKDPNTSGEKSALPRLSKPKEVTACQRYVDYWEELKAENIGMLLYGSVGTGKTFLASCIGNGLLEKRVPVVSTNFPRLLNLLQETREKQKLLDRLSVYKLLILDDLGVERDSAYAAEQIFNIIDARGSSGLPVIVTTNLTLEELEHPTSMQYARIYDRVLEMCPIRIKLTGDSRRRGNAEKRKKIAQQILLG